MPLEVLSLMGCRVAIAHIIAGGGTGVVTAAKRKGKQPSACHWMHHASCYDARMTNAVPMGDNGLAANT